MAGKDFLHARLTKLLDSGTHRSLPGMQQGVDFWSNDYLGFSRLLKEDAADLPRIAPGSRLISGDHPAIHDLERRIADFHGFPAALLFGSGYAANSGLLSCLARRGDTIVFDALSHASLRDGIRLSGAAARRCRHNDLDDYRRVLDSAAGGGEIFVVTESRFSMDGDVAPLRELTALCEQYGAHLIVDEAHSIGLDGHRGAGLISELGLADRVFAVVETYGKAPGYHGAAILGSGRLRDYLINFSRPFIFSTGPRPQQLAGLKGVYDLLNSQQSAERERLQQVIGCYRAAVTATFHGQQTSSDGPIQLIHLAGNERVMRVEAALRDAGMLVKGIRSPSVPVGTERLRICLHAFNTNDEVVHLVAALDAAIKDTPV